MIQIGARKHAHVGQEIARARGTAGASCSTRAEMGAPAAVEFMRYTEYTEWPFTPGSLPTGTDWPGIVMTRIGALKPCTSRENSSRFSDCAPSDSARSG